MRARQEIHYVFLCDLVGYSQLNARAQEACLVALWKTARRIPDIILKYASIWSTGDGFYLALPELSSKKGLHFYKHMDIFLKRCKESNLNIRGAIHCGHFELLNHISLGSSIYCGESLNELARIIDFADDSQIAISHEFIELAFPDRSLLSEFECTPPIEKDPFEFYVKHGEVVKFRINTKNQSNKISRYLQLKSELVDELTSIRNKVVDSLHLFGYDIFFNDVRLTLLERRVDNLDGQTKLITTDITTDKKIKKGFRFISDKSLDLIQIKNGEAQFSNNFIWFDIKNGDSPNDKVKWIKNVGLTTTFRFKKEYEHYSAIFIPTDDLQKSVFFIEIFIDLSDLSKSNLRSINRSIFYQASRRMGLLCREYFRW